MFRGKPPPKHGVHEISNNPNDIKVGPVVFTKPLNRLKSGTECCHHLTDGTLFSLPYNAVQNIPDAQTDYAFLPYMRNPQYRLRIYTKYTRGVQ